MLVSSSIQNNYFIAAALPFLPRQYVTITKYRRLLKTKQNDPQLSRAPYHLQRTSSALNSILPDTLAFLTTGLTLKEARRTISITLVQDISATYANSLDGYATALETNSVARSQFISAWGIEGWREEVFYAAWEAEVVRAGLLARWMVIVHM